MSFTYQAEEKTEDPDEEQAITDAIRRDPPYYTIILITSILLVAVVQFAAGLEQSILSAGFVKPAFLRNHEYWRILTGATTHGSVPHVLMNCYAFYSFGKIFEILTNKAHLAIVFLLSAIGGGVLSLMFVPDGISVGASGGIVGLIGYLVVYAFRRRQFISAEFRKNLLINIGFILIFGLLLFQVIDNFGHIGGLVTGSLYGLLQIPTDERIDPRVANSTVEFAGIASVGIYLATCIFSILLILRFV